MKRNEIQDIKLKDIKELKEIQQNKMRDLKRISLDRATGKLKNTAMIGKIKKNIAVILTIIRQKELIVK